MWVPYMDDDEWCQGWYGYGVEAGQIVEVSCDVDGNWATDSAEVKAHTEAELERVQAELLEESSTQKLSYLRYCAEAGEDPLRLLAVSAQQVQRSQTWLIGFEPHAASGFLRLTSLQRMGKEVPAAQAPEAVKSFLHLVEHAGPPACIVLDGIQKPEDMINAKVIGSVALIDVKVSKARKPWRVIAEVKKQAALCLKRRER